MWISQTQERKSMKEEKQPTPRELFDAKGTSIAKYARVKGLDKDILQRVLAGELTGERERKGGGKVRKCIAQLKEDAFWTEELSWEKAS